MRRLIAPWWVIPCAATFLGYFTLLLYCDLRRPAAEGMELEAAGASRGLLVTAVSPASPAARAGVRAGDRILSAGDRPLSSRTDWEVVQANVTFDRPVPLLVARGATTWHARWEVAPAGADYWRHREGIDLLVTRLVQLVGLLLGLVVVFRRPFDVGARMGGWLLATIGVFCISWPYRIADVWRALPLAAGAPLWLPFASTLALPALLLSFFIGFPRPAVRSALAWGAIWTPAVLIVAVHLRYLLTAVYLPGAGELPRDWFWWRWAGWIGYLGAAAAVAFVRFRRADAVERRRLGVMLLGGGIGAVAGGPIALAYWRGSETSLFASPAVGVATLCLLAVPLSFAYAILRHRLFDVSLIVRQGVRYALARRLLVSVVPLTVTVLAADVYWHRDRSIDDQFGARAPVYLGLAGFAIVAAKWRQTWLDALDRRFFRERYDAQRILHRVIEEVRRTRSLHEAAPLAVGQIELALHPTFATLLGRTEPGADSYHVVATAPPSAGPTTLPAGMKMVGLARLLGKPLELSEPGASGLSSHLPQEEAAMASQLGLELLVPIDAGPDRPDAVLALGARRSEEPYALEDRQLLWTIAESLAVLDDRGSSGAKRQETFAECPECGRCYDAGTPTCPADARALAAVGLPRVLAGRYRLEQRLGRGGMGVVYAAADVSLQRSVAVKVLREDLVGDRESAGRFEREARISARFTHPNVVTVYDFGVARGSRAFLVMERLEGDTLRAEIGRGPIGPDRAAAIMRGVCSAVDAAHRRSLIHRDLKPENVFLSSADGVENPKVLDFGIAKVMSGDGAVADGDTSIGVVIGTPRYMAPEQLRGGPPQPSWDIWALGLMTYEMLTGYHPFATLALGAPGAGVPPARPVPGGGSGQVPPGWQPYFDRWLSLEPSGRPRNAEELFGELEEMLRKR